MPFREIIWIHDPGGNVEHIEANGVTIEEVEHVVQNPVRTMVSESSGRPAAVGLTSAGRPLVVVYEEIDEITIYPITAFEPKD